MSSQNQPVTSNGDTQQQRAANVNHQTISQHACCPYFSNYSLQNQGLPVNVSSIRRSTPEDKLGDHSWPEPSTAWNGQAGWSDACWSPIDACQHFDRQQLNVNGAPSIAHVDTPVGHNPQYQCAASQIPPQHTSQQQLFQPLSFGQPTDILDYPQQLPPTCSPQIRGLGHTASQFGLLTPVSTYTQNSPSNELGPGTVYNFGSESQQIWDSTFDAALETKQGSDGLAIEMSNQWAAPPDEQSWREFDFESLNSLFAVDSSAISNQFTGSFNPAPDGQDGHISCHLAGLHPGQAPGALFDTFLTDMNYPDPDFSRISSEFDTTQRGLQPAFLGQEDRRNIASVLPELINASDTPSPTESIVRTPGRSSQKNDAKNALLIEWKAQGMSYKEIKARGGFEEAESTLRGRYRTLTKPREERLRRPEWRDRDVQILFAAVEHFAPANRQSQHGLDRGAFARRRAEPRIPWKQVSEYMADRGCYRPLEPASKLCKMAEEVYEGAIGIDLGTTYSCVANYEGTNVEIIANEQGSFTTPSFVSFTDEERLIGEAAKNQAAMNPVNTVFDIKRLIGRRFDDFTVKKDIESWPFKVVDQGGNPMVEVEYLKETKTFSPQEISSMVLMKMKEVAETKLGKKVSKAVITVPAYFNDNQRQATKDAGAIAGLNVLRIINEPTAAAIAYGLGSGKTDKERNVLIYDLGGGTFDVSLLNIQGGVFTVKATAGDTHLGGQDFDTNLLDHFKKEFQRKTKKDLSSDPRALRRLRTACERAKRTLSSATQTTVEIDSLFEGEDFNTQITRARFEDLNAKAFSGTLDPVAQVLKDAAIDKAKVDEIVLVGGSTRIPRIQKLLSDFFDGKKLEKSINPDEAVAYGAAVQAGILSGKATSAETADLLLLDVVPLSLGVAMEGNIFAPVVPRGQTVPTIKKRTFTTVQDGQTTVQFPVFQGERTNCEDNTSLGEFTLAPIPPMKAGDAALEVVFEVDVNGILKVTATEKSSGRSANITISNAVGKLSTGEIEKMVEDAAKFKTSDEAFTKKFEAKQQLESYIGRVEEIISDPGMSMKMKRGNKEKIEAALSDAMAQLEIEDSPPEDLKKKELALKRLITKAMATR